MNVKDRYLPPRVIQTVGLCLFVGAVVFWAASGRQSVLLVSSSISLISLGVYTDLRQTLTGITAKSGGGEDAGSSDERGPA